MIQNSKQSHWKVNLRLLVVVFMALAMILAACQTQPTETESPPPTATEAPQAEAPTQAPDEPQPVAEAPTELLAKEWVLITYGDAGNPVVVEPGTRVTANFNADGIMSGSSGCNSYSGSFQVDGGSITFGPMAVTAMACESGMEQETAYFAALESASTFEISDAGAPYSDRLLINYDTGKGYPEQLVYDAELPLTDTLWVLTAYGDATNPTPSQTGVVTTAIFAPDGALSGSAGCNNYNTSYIVQDNLIEIGMPSTTLMACERGMEQEQAYLAALELAESYRIGNGALEITYADGAAVLHFSALHMPLENVRWVLSLIDGQPLPAGIEATAVFTPGTDGQDSQVNGGAGCNGYFGPYVVDGNSIDIGPLGATQMMCEEAAMQVEAAFLAGLDSAQHYETILSQLTITTGTGSLIFYADRLPLEGPIWTLTAMGDKNNPQPPIPESNFTASFSRQFGMPSGWMSGTTGCNEYNSAYYSNLEEIKVNLPQLLQNTCTDAMTEAEQTYFLGFNSAREYRILGNELQVYYDNMVLIFLGAFPPPEGGGGPLTPLDDTQWWLHSIDTFLVIPGSEITTLFAINDDGQNGLVSGSAGCNSYNAPIAGVFQVGPINKTRAICETPAGVMEQENTYLAVLNAAQSFSLEGNTLLIGSELGTLVYHSTPPSPLPTLPTPEYTPEGPTPTPQTTPEITPEPTAEETPQETPEEPTPEPEGPVAVISAPAEALVNQPVNFDGTGSTPEGGIVSYVWDFGDASRPVEGAVVQLTFSIAGDYTVTLTVTDGDGQTDTTTFEITITE